METDVFVGNALTDLYATCMDLASSQNVFDTMQDRDVVSRTAWLSTHSWEEVFLEQVNDIQSMQVNEVKQV